MATLSDTSITVTFLATLTKALTLPGLGASSALAYSKQVPFSDGVADDEANECYSEQRTLANGASDDLDLTGVALQNPLGENIAFTAVKGILVYADPANTDDVEVGGALATAFSAMFGSATDKVLVPPGGMFLLYAPKAGYAVGAGATDILRIKNAAAGAQAIYDIVVLGTRAP